MSNIGIIKLVDRSSQLSKTNIKHVDTKEKLFVLLKNYLTRLFEEAGADTNSQLFWQHIQFL